MVNLLESIINNHILNYIAKISRIYNIPENKLKSLWENDIEQIVIYKSPANGVYYHKQTKMAFISPINQVVYGKLINGKVNKLNNNDIKLCKKWNFKIGI